MYRGKSFGREFSHLNKVRSIIPEQVKVMALTATATINTTKSIIITLNIDKPVVISVSPNKPNIIYSLTKKLEI